MSLTAEEIATKLTRITTLYAGSHSPNGQHCIMEAVAFVAGEPWSDAPACVSPVIAAFMRRWNDDLPDDATRTRLLKPLILPLVGTKGDDASEIRRAWMATDWLVRSLAPTFLRTVPTLAQHADALEAIGEIVDAVSASGAQPTIAAAGAAAGAAAWAAGAAAWAAAGAAARAAAEDAARAAAEAAARDAARAAAGAAARAAEAAAGAAAGAAAWAAAEDAAWAAGAAAWAALKGPTTKAQASAVALVLRMCAVGKAP